MVRLDIGEGDVVLVGAPARPMAPERVRAIEAAVASTAGILEAHLPQVASPRIGVTTQVLAVVVPAAAAASVLSRLAATLEYDVPVWVLDPSSGHLPGVRSAGRPIGSSASPFEGLFADHAAASFDKQLHLDAVLGEHDWKLDLEGGTIEFASGRFFRKRRSYAVQIAGTESFATGTWRWAWASPDPFPARLVAAADRIRALGTEAGVAELREPEVTLAGRDAHVFAMIASGLARASAYHRAPDDTGAAWVLLPDPTLALVPDRPAARVVEIFPRFLATFEVRDHRRALVAYLAHHGFRVSQDGAALVGRSAKETLCATFDAAGRFSGIETR